MWEPIHWNTASESSSRRVLAPSPRDWKHDDNIEVRPAQMELNSISAKHPVLRPGSCVEKRVRQASFNIRIHTTNDDFDKCPYRWIVCSCRQGCVYGCGNITTLSCIGRTFCCAHIVGSQDPHYCLCICILKIGKELAEHGIILFCTARARIGSIL